jgi:prepilin-type N-terminal cleavage/methylation domain-containing protein/prepilin-type processing-associated H-X9-DG protein
MLIISLFSLVLSNIVHIHSGRTGIFMQRKAFTLVEMLVVIAIIALLSTLIIYSVSKAVSSSRSAACAANLRQIGAALQLFTADNNGSFYIKPNEDIFGKNAKWYHTLLPYIPYKSASSQDKNVFLCPSDNRKLGDKCSYGINVYYDSGQGKAIPLAALTGGPSKVIYCGDSGQSQFVSWDIGWKSNTPTKCAKVEYRHLGKSRNQTVPYNSAQEVKDQRGAANFLFFDGHVESLRDDQLTEEQFKGYSNW